ncbi:MAG: hypothetical protein JW891_11100 [Candidatus Lokiarchaeota archaeon]|nr:hypothetical protein [Candidatus Lokiarchaeota archaeon]
MNFSKRERVLCALELHGEPDKIPIHNSGFEKTASSYQAFLKSKEYPEDKIGLKANQERYFGLTERELAEIRFWNADCQEMDPFGDKLISKTISNPQGHPGLELNPLNGKLYAFKPQVDTGILYRWYIDGYFKTPEALRECWDRYGKPFDYIKDEINYSSKIWNDYVDFLSPHVYPMARLGVAMHEALFEGMTIARAVYYMRKNPSFVHEVMAEYLKVNLELIKRLDEVGVDIVFYYDDLGYKGSSIFSLEHFRTFILPYYKKLYEECKKRSMFIVQHSCGYIDEFLPDMTSAGLNCIQALEPAAGVNLKVLKESLGDKLAFMGGIDATHALNFGTSKEIESEVKKRIHETAHGGGYIAGLSHNVLNAPWNNILIYRAALEKFRKYPLTV